MAILFHFLLMKKKERVATAQNVTGRGRSANPEEIIKENVDPKKDEPKATDKPLFEGYDFSQMATLAGIKSEDKK
jgi:hypothetical protein